ncbi:MAG: hypothetical protein QI199_05625, partial [Candidatus Korarchaeota archaeon]|nr:hypothetical protein [Candidatus Korarchaeota archaeon]
MRVKEMGPANMGIDPRVGMLASTYLAIIVVAHIYGQSLAPWVALPLLAALYGFLAPLPSTLALAALCYIIGAPLVPLILGAGLGTVAAALLGHASPVEIRAPRALPRKISLMFSGAALVLSLA